MYIYMSYTNIKMSIFAYIYINIFITVYKEDGKYKVKSNLRRFSLFNYYVYDGKA